MVCLGAVVFLAELLAPGLEHWISSVGAPISLSGIIIARVVLLPEGLSAINLPVQFFLFVTAKKLQPIVLFLYAR